MASRNLFCFDCQRPECMTWSLIPKGLNQYISLQPMQFPLIVKVPNIATNRIDDVSMKLILVYDVRNNMLYSTAWH